MCAQKLCFYISYLDSGMNYIPVELETVLPCTTIDVLRQKEDTDNNTYCL